MAQSKPTLFSDAGPQFEEACREALAALQDAADEWSEGDPETPARDEVLEFILAPFLERGIMRRSL
jgi:hypothetical protein